MTGMNRIPSYQPKPSTYAEGLRVCAQCGDEFKLHRYNRHRWTCSSECAKKRASEKSKAWYQNHPELLEKMREGARNNDLGQRREAQFGDPRDEEKLLNDLFILNNAPCARCGGVRFYPVHRTDKRTRFQTVSLIYTCIDQDCKKQKSVKSGTLFQKNYTPLPIWMEAIRQVTAGNTNSLALSRHLGVTQKTAWAMIQKLRPHAYASDPYVQWAKYPSKPLIRGSLLTK